MHGILIDYEGFLRKGSPWRFWGGQSLCRSLAGGGGAVSQREKSFVKSSVYSY